MIKLPRTASGGPCPSSPHRHGHSRLAEELLLQKELTEELPPACALACPLGKDHLQEIELTIRPDEGPYSGGAFLFCIRVPQGYPADPPTVRCLTKVFHPAIDPEGHTDLPYLKESWSQEGRLRTVFHALVQLFQLPDREDALNHAAGELLHRDRVAFNEQVRRSIAEGATVAGIHYPPALGERTIHLAPSCGED